jgi:hypothetical protein
MAPTLIEVPYLLIADLDNYHFRPNLSRQYDPDGGSIPAVGLEGAP